MGLNKRDVAIGSHLYINKENTPDQVRRWVRDMHEAKLRLIRLFMIWDHLEPREGTWQFDNYDACFDEASQLGMSVVPTLKSVSPPGWMRISGGTHDVMVLENETYWEHSMDYVRRIVTRYFQSPALHSWMLWNEPARRLEKNEKTVDDWVAFLKRTYNNDIQKLNAVYFRQYDTFEQLRELPKETAHAHVLSGFAERLDWTRYVISNLNDKLAKIAHEVKRIDDVHPVHVNPCSCSSSDYEAGQAFFSQMAHLDFIGTSAHPSWHSTRFADNRLHQAIAYLTDTMKSVNRDRFWVTELQGGTNIFSGYTYLCPNEHDITHWLWESIGAGAEAVVFWCFNKRSHGNEGGEWGLVNQLGKPSKRLRAATRVTDIIRRNQSLFNEAIVPDPDVYILYSDSSIILGEVEGDGYAINNPRNKEMCLDAITGAYLMCSDLGHNIALIDEARVIRDGLPDDAVLIVPGAFALEKGTCAAIQRFVTRGGKLIADGLFGFKDCQGYIDESNRDVLAEIFGAHVEDITATKSTFGLNVNIGTIDGWFLKLEMLPTMGSVIGRFGDGTPAIVQNGNAIRIGTVFFQQYMTKPSARHLKFLENALNIRKDIALLNPSRTLRMKVLSGTGYHILILLNRERDQSADLRLPRNMTVQPLNGGIMRQNSNEANVSLKAEEVLLFCIT